MSQKWVIILIFPLFSCCSPASQRTFFPEQDTQPPQFISGELLEANIFILEFNESIEIVYGDEIAIYPIISFTTEVDSNLVIVNMLDRPETSKEYKVSITVADESGNETCLIVNFWGKNENLARFVINEFTPAGSGNNPDALELYITESGSMNGVTLLIGTPSNFNAEYTFNELNVTTGDYIIFHCRPQFTSQEVTETDCKAVSGGLLSSDLAWDIWPSADMPLSGTNGVISIYESPMNQKLIDGVVYSNRSFDPDHNYLGWTSTTFPQIIELKELNGWICEGAVIKPEEAIFSDNSTGTRSLCRDSLSSDNNSFEDWHTVPTGSKSFGEVNIDEIYLTTD